MTIQLFVALTALLAGVFCVVAPPDRTRFIVGSWLIIAGVLWLVGGFVK